MKRERQRRRRKTHVWLVPGMIKYPTDETGVNWQSEWVQIPRESHVMVKECRIVAPRP